MPLPSSGQISMDQVRTELKKTGQISLNDTDVRNLAKKTSGQISMSDLHGKSAMYEAYVTMSFSVGSGQGSVSNDVIAPGVLLNAMYRRSTPYGYTLFVQVQGVVGYDYIRKIRVYSENKATLLWQYIYGTHPYYSEGRSDTYTWWRFHPECPALSGKYFVQIETL